MREVPIVSDFMGSVSLRHVDDGGIVAAGDPVVEIECMKVQFPVVAPASGVIRHRIALGEIVGEGDILAIIEVQDD